MAKLRYGARMTRLALILSTFVALALAGPLAAKESLGVFGNWGAFRDDARCYAIAMPEKRSGRRDFAAFASVGTWPTRGVRGQVHLRTSLALASNARARLTIGSQSFAMTGSGGDLWAADARQDAAILAAMRSAGTMRLRARDARGNSFTDRYSLEGAATALDAASVGCARRR